MSYLRDLYEVSQATFDYDPDAERIGEAVAGGRFAVVCQMAAYCPATDSLLPGLSSHICCDNDRKPLSFPTAEAATEYARGLMRTEAADEENHSDGFAGYLVWSEAGPQKGHVEMDPVGGASDADEEFPGSDRTAFPF